MDSVSQAVLGAAVGEVVLGSRVGNKAILWGAVAGTIPDLDVLAYPLMDQISQLSWHRGPSHAFFYLILAAPIMAWVINRLHKGKATWRHWTLLLLLAFITHVLLDSFTVYGTQLFRPFSHFPVGFNSISIVDPLYTVPLLIAVVVALFLKRNSRRRLRLIIAGLALSTLYLGITVGFKFHVNAVAQDNFVRQNIRAEKYMTAPTLLNSVLWRITAKVEDGFKVGYYSLLDSDRDIEFSYLPQRDSLLLPVRHTEALARLEWFSRGYYVVSESEGELHFADIRFGTIDVGQPDSRRFVFQWKIKETPARPERGEITQSEFKIDDPGRVFDNLWRRVLEK